MVCAIDLVNRAVLRAFVEVIDTMAGRAALQVTVGQGGPFAEDVAATVARVRGVELAVPIVSATAFTSDKTVLTVHGVDVANESHVRVYEARDAGGLEIDDPLVFLNTPDSVVVTRSFAERRGLKLEDTLTLDTTAGTRTFTVRGLLEPQGIARAYGGRLVVMDLYAAQMTFTRPGFINRVDVVVDRAASVDTVAAAIRSALPASFHVAAPEQRKVDLHRLMQSLRVMLSAVGVIALVGGSGSRAPPCAVS
jgi:putative ABC transport system permease protein